MQLYTYPGSIDEHAAAVRNSLADSLDYVAGFMRRQHGVIGVPDLESTLATLRSRNVHPRAFARYLSLVDEVESEDWPAAVSRLGQLADLIGDEPAFEVLPYSQEVLGEDYQRFAEILFPADFGPQPIVEPGETVRRDATRHLKQALTVIEAAMPNLAEEIRAMWSRVYVGAANPDEGVRGYGGVTSFLLWGASFMNPAVYHSTCKAAIYYAHEATHGLLFALSCNEPLVRNDLAERYPSPLRKERRPMDGIYHATLVCARIVDLCQNLLDAGLVHELDTEDQAVLEMRDGMVGKFLDGATTVEKHGVLSPLASDLLRQAQSRCNALA